MAGHERIRFQTETSSIYVVERVALDGMAWRRESATLGSGVLRSDGGALVAWPDVEIGERCELWTEPINPPWPRLVLTSQVVAVMAREPDQAAGGALPERLVKRWKGAPGWNKLVDRADNALRRDVVRPGHHHIIGTASSGPALEFVPFVVDGRSISLPCYELREKLDAVTEESRRTCYVCGKPGTLRRGSPQLVVCDTDMGHGDEAPKIVIEPPPGHRRVSARRPDPPSGRLGSTEQSLD